MLTVEQKEMVNNWICNKKPCFDDAFTDMAICSEVFNRSGNDGQIGRDVFIFLDGMVDSGALKKSSGWCGTVYWRA